MRRRVAPTRVARVGRVLFQALGLLLLVWVVVGPYRTGGSWLFVLLLLGYFAIFALRGRRTPTPGIATTPVVPVPESSRPNSMSAWEQARQRFGALSAEYAAFECDPLAVLRRPALADVRVPSTARFVDAFAQALALDTDERPPESHAVAFGIAVDAAERAWRAARMTADRLQVALLSPGERATVDRVIKLLTTATRSDNNAERLVAYSRARSELGKLAATGVVRLPVPAQAVIDQAARGALPPGPTEVGPASPAPPATPSAGR